MHFSHWMPLEPERLDAMPASLAAVQVRRAEGPIAYPGGLTTMLLFFYSDDPAATLRRVLGPELDQPGAFGQGPLWFRVAIGPNAETIIARRYQRFVERFHTPPLWQDKLQATPDA